MATSNNIEASGPECLNWNCGDVAASLAELLKYVEDEAQKATAWYWRNKRWKSFCSRWVQLLAVVLTSAAAIIPIVGQLIPQDPLNLKSGLWASLLVGLAAALLALDKAFGFSSGWARYVLAATNIRKSLEEFKMDWTTLIAAACPNPSPQQIEALIQRAREFRVGVESIVLQETKDWVSEFQNNIAQLEKDVSSQVAVLKAQSEKIAQGQELASQPGSIQLTIPNADKSDNATVQIKLENSAGWVADGSAVGSKTWARLNLVPGQYQVTISATVNARIVSSTAVIVVKPGEIAQAELALSV